MHGLAGLHRVGQQVAHRSSSSSSSHPGHLRQQQCRALAACRPLVTPCRRRHVRAAAAEPVTDAATSQQAYDDLFQKATENTFDSPDGQLHGRSGRRCILEDGERMLDRCIQMRPHDMRARLTLLRNIMLQDMGRERDVPPLAVDTLRHGGVSGADMTSPAYISVLQVVLLALKALYKQDQQQGVPAFVAAASDAVPGMASDIARLAAAFAADMDARSQEERAALLIKRSYRSCVDLQFVTGRHHAESAVLLSVQEQ